MSGIRASSLLEVMAHAVMISKARLIEDRKRG